MFMRIWSMRLNIAQFFSESLAQKRMKNKIEQLLWKYKHGNNIHEQEKSAKQMNHTNMFLTCHKDWTEVIQLNTSLFKIHLFIIRGKAQQKGIKTASLR